MKKIMKNLLNNLSNEEKNRIREQYVGGMSVDNSRFKKLMESKLGNVKPLISEQPTLCDKTFDDLKTKATPNTSWNLAKKDGEWSLTLGDFCTKDIIIYGVTQPLKDNLETSVIKIDDTKNKIYFNGFNVGSKK